MEALPANAKLYTARFCGEPVTDTTRGWMRRTKRSYPTVMRWLRAGRDMTPPGLKVYKGILCNGRKVAGSLDRLSAIYELDRDTARYRIAHQIPLDKPLIAGAQPKTFSVTRYDGVKLKGTVKELAPQCNCTEQALRRHIKAGGLVGTDPSPYRVYKNQDGKPAATPRVFKGYPWTPAVKHLQRWCRAPIDPYIADCIAEADYRRVEALWERRG